MHAYSKAQINFFLTNHAAVPDVVVSSAYNLTSSKRDRQSNNHQKLRTSSLARLFEDKSIALLTQSTLERTTQNSQGARSVERKFLNAVHTFTKA